MLLYFTDRARAWGTAPAGFLTEPQQASEGSVILLGLPVEVDRMARRQSFLLHYPFQQRVRLRQ
jgi:hypothetical protein